MVRRRTPSGSRAKEEEYSQIPTPVPSVARNDEQTRKEETVEKDEEPRASSIGGQGEQIPDTPIVVYKSNPGSRDDSSQSSAQSGKASTDHRPSRPTNHERRDSHDLLRRLSRATSLSAGSSPNTTIDGGIQRPRSSQDFNSEEKTPMPCRTRSVDAARNAGEEKGKSDEGDDSATPQPSKQQMFSKTPAKTPVVTGAWVETPYTLMKKDLEQVSKGSQGQVDGKGGNSQERPTSAKATGEASAVRPADKASDVRIQNATDPKKVPKQERIPYTGPKLPKSALDAIVRDMKEYKALSDSPNALPVGEDTIKSFEDLVLDDNTGTLDLAIFNPNPKPTLTTAETTEKPGPPSPSASATSSKASSSSSSSLSDLYLDTETLSSKLAKTTNPDLRERIILDHRMNARLLHLGLSLKDCRKVIDRIEAYVLSLDKRGQSQPNGATTLTQLPTSIPAKHIDWGSTPLTDYIPLLIPIPRLYTWPATSHLPRLTRLGTALAIVWCWYITELILCDIYCHKFYAVSCSNFGVDIYAPRMPLVTVTMLSRWLRLPKLGAYLWVFLRPFVVLVAQALGLWDGFAGPGMGTGMPRGGAGRVGAGGMGNSMPSGFEDPRPDSMMGDEIL